MSESSNGRAQGSVGYLTFVCIVSALGGLLFGFDTIVISGTVSAVKNQFQLSELMEGFFVSSALIGCVLGSGLAGRLSDSFGRKRVLLLSALLFQVTAFGSACAWSPVSLIAFRFVGGIGIGVASMACPLYISEISPPHLRGRMVSLFQFAITVGLCMSLFSNAYLQHLSVTTTGTAGGVYQKFVVAEVWRAMFLAGSLPALLFTVLCLPIAESPRWLAKMGRYDQASRVLARICGVTEATKVLAEIKDAIAHEGGSVMELFKPGLRRALFVALFLSIVSEMSGVSIVFYYGPGILKKAGLKFGDALNGFVVIGLVIMVFTMLAVWLMDQLGRRVLLFWGNLGCCVALASLGYFFHIGQTSGTILVALICLFVACFAFSIGPIKWVVMSEIFPTRIRGQAVAIATMAVWVTDAVYNQLFPMVSKPLGIAGCFFIFAGVLVPQFFFVWKIMPETKGRTLEEIEQSWLKHQKKGTHP